VLAAAADAVTPADQIRREGGPVRETPGPA
jgi:hypothetical protein